MLFCFLCRQNPQCEGVHSDRILFNAKAPSRGRVLYIVTDNGDGSYKLHAGEACGVTASAKFNVYATEDPTSMCLGSLIAISTTASTSKLRLVPGSSPFSLSSQPGYALQTSVDEKQDLRVQIPANDTQLSGILKSLKVEMDKKREFGKRSFRLAKEGEPHDISLSMRKGKVVFGITNDFCIKHGLKTMGRAEDGNSTLVECEVDSILPVMAGAADFYYHLNRTSSRSFLPRPRKVNGKSQLAPSLVSLECFEVEQTGDYGPDLQRLLNAKPENLIRDEVIEVTESKDKGKLYGFKVTNNTSIPLYAALFYFSMSDLRISTYPSYLISIGPTAPCSQKSRFLL